MNRPLTSVTVPGRLIGARVPDGNGAAIAPRRRPMIRSKVAGLAMRNVTGFTADSGRMPFSLSSTPAASSSFFCRYSSVA